VKTRSGNSGDQVSPPMGHAAAGPDPLRRSLLGWGVSLAAGSVIAPLTGCSDAGGWVDTLPEPPILGAAVDGALSLDLRLGYVTQPMWVAPASAANTFPGAASLRMTRLRRYNATTMAPTLRVKPGDTLKIRLYNDLPANTKQSSLRFLNYQNSTNLHFHGLHVDPREHRPGVFGDYVVDAPDAGVKPGAMRYHEVKIPEHHTSGVFWYHPHLHGSSNGQVGSGMYGAIQIVDPGSVFLDSSRIRERIIFVHKHNLTTDGRTDNFYESVESPVSSFLLNGSFQPTILMRPGEVQVWHFINSATFLPFNPALDGHDMEAFARDGDSFSRYFKTVNAATAAEFRSADAGWPANDPRWQRWPGGLLYPGGRLSVVVKASNTPGSYYLRSLPAPAVPEESYEEIVALVRVEGDPVAAVKPLAGNLSVGGELEEITDAELAMGGGVQRTLVVGVLFDATLSKAKTPANAADAEEWQIPEGEIDPKVSCCMFLAGGGAAGAPAPAAPPAIPANGFMAPFQSPVSDKIVVNSEAVEEWTVYNLNTYPHPFHIHVNDIFVCKINGEPLAQRFWCDTIPIPPNGSVTFRTRFADFKGLYVWHCHALDHEDMGMMQAVEVIGQA
jgi:FtsP/CotA-like multicopper oxidase with cupredoxin domain